MENIKVGTAVVGPACTPWCPPNPHPPTHPQQQQLLVHFCAFPARLALRPSRRAAFRCAPQVNVCVYAFDCLSINGRTLLREPLTARREALASALEPLHGHLEFATAKVKWPAGAPSWQHIAAVYPSIRAVLCAQQASAGQHLSGAHASSRRCARHAVAQAPPSPAWTRLAPDPAAIPLLCRPRATWRS